MQLKTGLPVVLSIGAIWYSMHANATGAIGAARSGCWQLEAVNRVRFQPRAGQGAAMVGGTIQGSNDSPTNGFTVLATISAQPPDGQWTELTFGNVTPYRYVKYYGPPGSYGQIAEIEFYSGGSRLTGDGFGTVGSRSGNTWQNALDGNAATFFDGPIANDVYVGIDAAAGRVVDAPVYSPPAGSYAGPQSVTISSATAGAAIRYTTNGSDPVVSGLTYSGPITIGNGSTTLRAVATKACTLTSSTTLGLYTVGGGSSTRSSLHLGNSLTDSINAYLQPLAASGGITLDYWRYTVPGAGTYVYVTGGGGGGISDIGANVRSKAYNHISMQPASNMPCIPTGYDLEANWSNRSDAANMESVWTDAVGPNPNVQMWVYSTWPAPTSYLTCMTGGGWLRDKTIWNPPTPTDWEDAVSHMTQWNELVQADMVSKFPARVTPYIVPAGLGLVNLKHAIEAGAVPGIATTGFWTFAFNQGQSTDDHLTTEGRYFVTLIFYAAMFQRSPVGLAYANTTLTSAQAATLQNIAWQTVTGYARSGIGR